MTLLEFKAAKRLPNRAESPREGGQFAKVEDFQPLDGLPNPQVCGVTSSLPNRLLVVYTSSVVSPVSDESVYGTGISQSAL